MAVLNRTKEPATAEEPTAVNAEGAPVTSDQAVVDDRAAAGRRRFWRRRARTGPPVGARVAAAGAAAGAGTAILIARIIRLVAGVVVLLIGLGILFVVFKASPSNTIVSHVHDWAHWLVGPFRGMFHLHGARGTLALNWGIAIIVYLAVAWLISRIVLAPARLLTRRRTAATA
jgi:hypothetical protein